MLAQKSCSSAPVRGAAARAPVRVSRRVMAPVRAQQKQEPGALDKVR
jgi:hypothetical protein